MTHGSNRVLDVGALARVEGEGGLRVVVRDGAVSDVALDIYEPPRFFEAFLVGRSYREVPDITARICGICPVAYQMSSCAALEEALGVTVTDQVQALRRLLYCGEWIQSHSLHIYFLHAPDFLGCADAVELAHRDAERVQGGIELKRTGNQIMEVVGGRSVHPVNVRVGGFYKAPAPAEIQRLEEPLKRALNVAVDTVGWVAGFDFPELHRDYLFVSLDGGGEYPLDRGTVVSSAGLRCSPGEFADIAIEEHVERSTALHSRLYGRDTYLTGPLARYALNHRYLTPLARQAASDAGLERPCRNPFRSIVVRAVELVVACEEALRIVKEYEPPHPAAASLPEPVTHSLVTHSPVTHGTISGTGATEAPRGLLLHRYEVDAEGLVARARIMPPTSQNQLAIEEDLRAVAESGLDLADEELVHQAELAVRNHDPCISCAAHFLDVSFERHP